MLGAGGLLLGRIDLALLALPLVVALAWTSQRRPLDEAMSVATLTIAEPTDAEVAFELRFEVPAGVQAVVVRYMFLGGEACEVALAVPFTRDIVGDIPLFHSGPQELARFEYRFLGTDAGATCDSAEPLVASRVIPSAYTPLASLPLPWRLRGLTGTHESARWRGG